MSDRLRARIGAVLLILAGLVFALRLATASHDRAWSAGAAPRSSYALVVGTVTLDDLMHCLMDRVVVAPGERQVVQRGPGSWLVDGMAPIDEVKRLIDVDAVPGEGAYATAAGFMMFMMKRVPDRAEGFEFAGHRFEAVDIDNYRIDQVLVTREPAAAATE